MSRSWAGGSTTAWRRLRLVVLRRDEYQCQLQLEGCTGQAKWSLTAKYAAHVHHIKGKAATGDDPNHLVTSCVSCNLAVGDPTAQRHDPEPRPVSNW